MVNDRRTFDLTFGAERGCAAARKGRMKVADKGGGSHGAMFVLLV